jgi:preprotein translocase subunit SecF
MDKNINFSSKFKIANILSLLLFFISVLFIFFKGLNYGIDFKGGTLIELRTDNKNIDISDIRSSLNSLNLGDVNVKNLVEKVTI